MNYKSSVYNCRTAFEKFLKSIDTENANYLNGILKATNEMLIDSGVKLTSKIKIFKYWLKNKKGANRYRLMMTMCSIMSGLGIHGEDIPYQEDALMILRMTEDVFLWYTQKSL